MKRNTQRILAVSSGGGHWVELLRVLPAFADLDVACVTVSRAYECESPGRRFYAVNDATRWNKLALLWMAIRLIYIMLRERPDVVITTGAAPGYFALIFGRWFRAKTIWLDSIANIDELSMSGRMAGKYASLWLTQWPHLETPDGPSYRGAVL